MDGPRFDDLARALAAKGVPRRGVVRAAAGGTLGAVLALRRRGAGAQAACTRDTDCVVPDATPCTGARCEAGACVVVSVACVPGFVCCGGGCVPPCAPTQVLDAGCRCVDAGPGDGEGEADDAPAADETPVATTRETPAAGADATADPAAGRPAQIRAGGCGEDEQGEVVQPLTDVGAPEGAIEGQTGAVVAETSFTPAVPRSLDELLAAGHAIDVRLSAEETGTSVACGEIGGVRDADGALAIGLRERNGSGFSGVAYLAPSATGGAGTTDVTVFVAQGLAAR